MSRRTGQLRIFESVAGAAIIAATALAIVLLCTWLRLPAQDVDELEAYDPQAAGSPAAATCDERLATARRSATSDGALLVSATTLIECPDAFDGERIEYRGEAVSAVLLRDDRAWLQVNDDVYSVAGPIPEHRQSVGGNAGLAVNVPAAVGRRITTVGHAHHRGDVLTVRGRFRRAAADDGGAPSIWADEANDVVRGGRVDSPVLVRRVAVAAVLAAVTGAVAAVRVRRTRWWWQ
jgi:hypothetical protein